MPTFEKPTRLQANRFLVVARLRHSKTAGDAGDDRFGKYP